MFLSAPVLKGLFPSRRLRDSLPWTSSDSSLCCLENLERESAAIAMPNPRQTMLILMITPLPRIQLVN